MDKEALSELKYRELQRLAKEKGIKANQPKETLIKEILKCSETDLEKQDNKKESETYLESTQNLIQEKTKTENLDQPVCMEEDLTSDTQEGNKLNETFEVKDSSILTNDEDVKSNNQKKGKISAFNTPTLLNASDRFEQFFALDEERIPVLSSASPPRQYAPKTSLKLLSPSNKITPTIATGAGRNAIPTSGCKKRNSAICTPKSLAKVTKNIQSSLKRELPKRSNVARTPGCIQKPSMSGLSNKESGTGATMINSTAKKVRLAETENSFKFITQRSNIPKFVKSTMPDFAKLHAREFSKMDTLDNYLEKKKERAYALTPGPKSAKKPAITSTTKGSLRKPVLQSFGSGKNKVPVKRTPQNFQINLNSNQDRKMEKAYAPPIMTIKDAKFKFSSDATAKQQQENGSKNKPFVFQAKAAKIHAQQENKVLSNISNSSLAGNNSLSKNNFDLKASLAKPLSYKPHKGKLGQWNPKKTLEERKALAKKTSCKSKKGDVIKGVRLNKRAELLIKRRGLQSN